MTSDQLTGKYARLRAELDSARAEPAWTLGRNGRIARLARELATVERTLAAQRVGARLIDLDQPTPASTQSGHRAAA